MKRILNKNGIKNLARIINHKVIRVRSKERGNKISDDHMFHGTYEDLIDLINKTTGFKVTKEHWQKPPYTMCIYLSAKKNE